MPHQLQLAAAALGHCPPLGVGAVGIAQERSQRFVMIAVMAWGDGSHRVFWDGVLS